MPTPRPLLSLVADVGGTNTRVALADGATLRTESIKRYPNRDYASLADVLRNYLTEQGNPDCDAACAAVAGPVAGGTARLTNLDWSIDLDMLADAAQAETVALLNDLQAQGHGVAHVPPERLRQILPGQPASEDAPRLVIGVGTGFNIAPIYTHQGLTLVTAAEAGHASLPAHDEEMLSLARYVANVHGFADIEEALSGRGVENIYAWLGQHQHGDPARLPASEILACLAGARTLQATETARIFTHCLGTVAGDLALTHLPYGGIFFSGGVARAFAPYLAEFGFRESFGAKGRFSVLMERFSLHVIEDDFAALLGCAGHLCEIHEAQSASRAV